MLPVRQLTVNGMFHRRNQPWQWSQHAVRPVTAVTRMDVRRAE